MIVWAIVVAAGGGTRFGGPKQYETLGHQRVLDWSLQAARSVSDGVVLAVSAERAQSPEPGADIVVAGGATRSQSVRAALGAVPSNADVIVVHDAARPLASAGLFRGVVSAVAGGASAAVPGLPVTDTVKRVRDGLVSATLDRAELVTVQTPQAFRATALRHAHAVGGEATDDAALVEAGGGDVVVVEGEPANVKLTTRDDLDGARVLLEAKALR
ncbi:MAG: 2-C-methyl-D-erythritol 4-phosphate cytidylyltransferase [Acidimicrobiales bacterium]